MKKFLSLVLALVMTMSLVTVGAGATEYKDLTDKNEIQYEEAVAVLNKLGIITGYADGSFQPTGSLTRGAAAKIIVSLMIGPEAANALTVTAAPYKDVPVTNTFAAVISYCKTDKIISGYGDGTFRPSASLTGYAFSKMLLGALGYSSEYEGFTGEGWTMNVARLNSSAGLLNDIVDFKGNDGVNRETACQLALNTLKATLVEYTGGMSVTSAAGNITQKPERNYVTSNNKNINKNIYGGDAISGTESGNTSAYYTLQFGEQHFQDLKLYKEGTDADDFGRPANQWAYKSVKIGTYALTPDYVYTTGPNGDTAADKVKDMGLKGFKFVDKDDTTPGVQFNVKVNGADLEMGQTGNYLDLDSNSEILEFIADKLTGNGAQIEVYLEDGAADTIKAVVVIYTQMMRVNSVKSSEVSLKQLDDKAGNLWIDTNENGNIDSSEKVIYTVPSVKPVKDDEDAFKALKDLKTDDYVLVTPVVDGSTYKVGSVAVPQTVTGTLNNIKVKSKNQAVNGITVADTAYSMSKLWSSEDDELQASTRLTSKETTAYLDAFGYAIYVTDVTASNSTIIIDEIYNANENGKLVKYAKGWDASGNELSLNLGTKSLGGEDALQGTVWEYKTSTSNSADYQLVNQSVSNTAGALVGSVTGTHVQYGDHSLYSLAQNFDANVKFIFLSKDSDDPADVTGVVIHEGVTEVGAADNRQTLHYILNKDRTKIVTVVVENDDDAANTANLLFFQKVTDHRNNADNKLVAFFTAYINGEEMTNLQLDKNILDQSAANGYNNKFFTYSKNETTGVYTLSSYTKTDKVTAVQTDVKLTVSNIINKTYINLGSVDYLNAKGAKVIDLYTDDGKSYESLKDIAESGLLSFKVSAIYNGDTDANGFKTVSYIFITGNGGQANDFTYTAGVPATAVSVFTDPACTVAAATGTKFPAGTTLYVKAGTALSSVTSSVNGFELVGFDNSDKKAIYKMTPNADFTGNKATFTTVGAADFVTVTGGNFADAEGNTLTTGDIVEKGATLQVTTIGALKAIGTALSGAGTGTMKLKTAPATATDRAVYTFVTDGAVSYNESNEVTGWVDLAVVKDITGTSAGKFTVTVTPSETGIIEVDKQITYTVAISGGAVTGDASDTVTVAFANLDRATFHAPVLAEVNCTTVGTTATSPITTISADAASPGTDTATEYTVVGLLKGGAAPTITWANV